MIVKHFGVSSPGERLGKESFVLLPKCHRQLLVPKLMGCVWLAVTVLREAGMQGAGCRGVGERTEWGWKTQGAGVWAGRSHGMLVAAFPCQQVEEIT